jgi:hypothetical protein
MLSRTVSFHTDGLAGIVCRYFERESRATLQPEELRKTKNLEGFVRFG